MVKITNNNGHISNHNLMVDLIILKLVNSTISNGYNSTIMYG